MARNRRCLKKNVIDEMHSREKTCELCEIHLPPERFRHGNTFEIDHIVPISLGGTDESSNLRWLCRYHNRSIRNKGAAA